MKRRIIKKNINRFITPYIKNLPMVTTHAIIEDVELSKDEFIMQHVYERQHIVFNGKRKNEGDRGLHCDNLMLNIRRTEKCIKNILYQFEHVYLRVAPEVYGSNVYVRLISE